jgi:protein-glutamine gamma-glutamyltransferase
MNTEPLYNRMLLAVMLLGVAAYAAAGPAILLAVFAVPLAYAAWRYSQRADGPSQLPTFAVNTLLFAAIAFATYRTATQGFDVSYVAELVVLLQLIKLTDRRTPRDDAQILFLAVFLAIAAMLTSNTLWVGFILALFLPVLVSAVMLFQIHKGQVAAGVTPAPPPAQPERRAGRGQVRQRSAFNRHFRLTAGFATVATLMAALAIFIIMPRGIGENTFGNWGNPQRRSVTGFTDRVSLGTRGVISNSPTVVLDLMVREFTEDGSGLPLGSIESVYYLRGAVLDVYERGEWRPSRSLPTGEPKRGNMLDLAPTQEGTVTPRGGPLIQQTINLRSTAGNRNNTRLFALWRPVRIEVQRHSRLAINVTDGIIERSGEPGPLTYIVWSTNADLPGTEPFERTPISFASEPIYELAARLLTEAGISLDPTVRPISDDSRASRIIQDYLRANFAYSLDEQYIPAEAHPIEHFLFTTRQGHCEYFASAMVAMCRSVGIYSRLVTGYVAAEYNQASGHYTVRESNAHAWVEVETGRNRWRRFDPTPQSDLVRIHRPQQTLLSRARNFFGAIEFAWNTSIVGFDAGRRERLLGAERVRDSRLIQRIDSIAASTPLSDRQSAAGLIGRLALVFVALALPATGGYLIWIWARKLLPRSVRRRRRAPDAQFQFYTRYLDALARRGHPKPEWSPPLTHAQNLPEPGLAGPATDIARLFYQARFAGRPMSEAELQRINVLIARIAHSGDETPAPAA